MRKRILQAFALPALLIAAAVAIAGCGSDDPPASAEAASADTPVKVRFAVISSSGQSEVPYAIKTLGLDKKYGLELEQVDFTTPGQQYTMLRSGKTDVTAGNFVDLLRQREAGLPIQAFHGFQGYSNRIVVKPDSPIEDFADLKGKKVGQFGTTFLDWLILRAAGSEAYGIDLEKDATPVQGSPPLLNTFLEKGQVDATLQFSTLTLAPLAQDQQRILTDVPEVMKAGGLDPDSFYLNWIVTEEWIEENPGALERLNAAVGEAYEALKTDDSLWPPLGKVIGIENEAGVAGYRDLERKVNNPPYDESLIEPTQKLVDALRETAGAEAVGVSKVDPEAFAFPGPPDEEK